MIRPTTPDRFHSAPAPVSSVRHLSIVVPLYNESSNIEPLFEKIERVMAWLKNTYAHEIIFVNDGSHDNSQSTLERLSDTHPHIRVIELSRNFGKEMALSAGMHFANGDAVLSLDADLQHPPEMIPDFLEKWQNGADIVIGVRQYVSRGDLFRRTGSWLFYRIMDSISEIPIVPRSTDFRLIDRRVVREFNRFTEHNRLARGLLDWLGFRREYVVFHAPERIHGRPAYSRLALVRLALHAFVSHSLFPLKLSGYIGTLITVFSGLLGCYILMTQYFLENLYRDTPYYLGFSGTAMLGILNLFLIGIVLMSLGIIALYIGNIHAEATNRPMYVVRSTHNMEEKDSV